MGKAPKVPTLKVDPVDKLPLSDAGEWAAEKHRCLSEYIDAAWGARQYWSRLGGSCAYVDFFSGPGRQYIEETDEIINGSPVNAWVASNLKPAPFSQLYISDRRGFVQACEKRLATLRAPVTVAALNAIEAAAVVAKRLDPKGLHLVFVDPYGLKQLSWRIFEPLLALPRIDFIVHFSSQGLARNMDRYFEMDPSPLDDVAPGWRAAVEPGGKDTMRWQFFHYWVSLFTGHHKFKLARSVPLFVTGTNAPMYRLVLLSRHELAEKLWNAVSEDPSQSRLFM